MWKRWLAAAAAIAALTSAVSTAGAAENSEKQYIVRYREPEQSVSLMSAEESTARSFDVVSEDVLMELLEEDCLEWYEEDYSVELFESVPPEQDADEPEEDTPAPDDAPDRKYDESKWDLAMVQADFAYTLNCTGQEVRIGVVDSGIAEHDDLKGNVLPGYNYIDSTADTDDTYGHGTFVSGIIAALDDGNGIIGVAPKAKLVPLKCFDGKTTKVSVICKAIYGAVDDFDCDIINMSLGLSNHSQALKEAVDYAVSKGVIITAAVGNQGGTDLYYPAAYENVIGVGSVNRAGTVSPTSQHNESVFLTAPGSEIKSTGYTGGYTSGSGTSYATPFVTAAVAVMMSADEDITLEQVKDLLSASAVDRGEEGYDEYYGYGILNIENCLEKMLEGMDYFISPVETEGEKTCAVVYNNTDGELTGLLAAGEYDGRAMVTFQTSALTVPAGRTVPVENSLSENFVKLFIWSGLEDNTVVSNTRSVGAQREETPSGEMLLIPVDLSGLAGEKDFSLLVRDAEGGVMYALQDKNPESGVYEIAVPRQSVTQTPEGAENPCERVLSAQINGTGTTISVQLHTFEDVTVPPEKAENGYTEHICSVCGYTYRDQETEAIGYFVTYDANGGEDAPQTQNKRPAEPLLLSGDLPVREGYTFLGWSADPNAESPAYQAGGEYCAEEDITLYAVWSVNTYHIIYEVDGAEYKTVEVPYGETITPEKAPVKAGYAFSGWSGVPETMPAHDVTVSGTLTQVPSTGGSGSGGGSGSQGGSAVPSQPEVPKPDPTGPETEESTDTPPEDNTDKPPEENTAELLSFSDINEDDWFYESVGFAVREGLMNGVSETEFAPQVKLTRAMFVTVLYRMDREPETAGEISFSDVPEQTYYTEAVRWAACNGIVRGISETEFAPDLEITREQMAVMAYRYAVYQGYPIRIPLTIPYSDTADISAFALNAVKWAFAEEILVGNDEGAFCPLDTATRAEAAALFMRLYERIQR